MCKVVSYDTIQCMKNISSHVEEFMKEYPFLSKFLRQGVVNYKALSRTIEPEISQRIGEKVSTGAIAVSLQRLHHRDKDKLYSLIGRLRGVRVVSRVAMYSVQDTARLYAYLADIYKNDAIDRPFILVIPNETSVELYAEKLVDGIFVSKKSDLSLSALIVSRETTNKTEIGGLSYPLQVLAEHGVLVNAVAATFNEEIIIIEEYLTDRAASILRHSMWR